MPWDIFGVQKEGPQTAQELHILNVYKDPDFLADVDNIFSKLKPVVVSEYEIKKPAMKAVFVKKAKWKFATHKEFLARLRLVNLEQRKQMLEIFRHTNVSQLETVTEKYWIRPADIQFYLEGHAIGDNVHREAYRPYHIMRDPYADFVLRFSADITKEDFMQAWKDISSRKEELFKGKVPKNKLPVYDNLLYAIFKQRQAGKSFPAIYKLYETKKLPNYKGSNALFRDETGDKLEQYYHKYKPKPPV